MFGYTERPSCRESDTRTVSGYSLRKLGGKTARGQPKFVSHRILSRMQYIPERIIVFNIEFF